MGFDVETRWTFHVGESIIEKIVGRPDDDTDQWHEEAIAAAEHHIKSNYLALIAQGPLPEIEVVW